MTGVSNRLKLASAPPDPVERVLKTIEEWVQETEEGKVWLGRLAAEVGVPVQLLLPFEDEKVGGTD